PQTKSFEAVTAIPRLMAGSRVSIGLVIAVLGVVAMWVFLFRTRAGFAQQVGGLAPNAARYAGFSSRRALWTALLVSGGAAGLAAVVHTGSDWLGFAAGMGAGAILAAVFGVLVIWLNTNQYATGLALSLFGAGFSAFAGIKYVQEKLPARPHFEIPFLADIP